MLTTDEEHYILTHAYVPEHVVSLVTNLSAGQPFLIDDYFCCCRDDWVILIGYPLQDNFNSEILKGVLEKIKKKFIPERISLIAPEPVAGLGLSCRERDSDYYYTLDIRNSAICSPIKRNLRKAARRLRVESAAIMGDAHQDLMDEFVQNVQPPVRVKNLLLKMPQYVEVAAHSHVLNAWDSNDALAAFYVIDFAAENFTNYIIGCYSKINYIRGASDLLMLELLNLSNEKGKAYIHLGLGVNNGIRRFKEKWGAKPTRRYEMFELHIKRPLIRQALKLFGKIYRT